MHGLRVLHKLNMPNSFAMRARAEILTLEAAQGAVLHDLMRQAYNEGASVFGELRRDSAQHGAIILIAGIVPRKDAVKIAKLLAEVVPSNCEQPPSRT